MEISIRERGRFLEDELSINHFSYHKTMKHKIGNILLFTRYFILSKYGYATIILLFAVWIIFFDHNSKMKKWQLKAENSNIRKENALLKRRIRYNTIKIESLYNSKYSIEQYAREQYGMKAPDEDVFLFAE